MNALAGRYPPGGLGVGAADVAKELWPLLAGVATGIASFAGAIFTWIKWRQDAQNLRADAALAREKQKGDLVSIAQRVAGELVQDLRDEVKRLRDEVAALEAEMLQLRKEHADTLAAKDAELSILRGELRQKDATIDALQRYITANGLPQPTPQPHVFIVPPGDGPGPVESL
jgi:cell division protein FtsB